MPFTFQIFLPSFLLPKCESPVFSPISRAFIQDFRRDLILAGTASKLLVIK
uniref:Uncharacterized protein n=1 Tax=Picea sitchensis TaxID=3332 RepID=A9NJZ5_PICSI|nr:unknown [Picea sitchensis]